MTERSFIQSNTLGAASTDYHISLDKRIDCDCGRLLFVVEGNKIEIECRRCKKKKVIVYDKIKEEFKVIE